VTTLLQINASIHADPATGQAFVEDDGSRNGTFLNEARLASGERRQLRDNDRLRLGSTTFVVKLLRGFAVCRGVTVGSALAKVNGTSRDVAIT